MQESPAAPDPSPADAAVAQPSAPDAASAPGVVPLGDAQADATRPTTRRARAQARIAEARERAIAAERQLREMRPANDWVDAAYEVYDRDLTVGGGVLSGALAYRLFLYILPFSFVLTLITGAATRLSNADPATAASSAGLSGIVAQSLADSEKLSNGNTIAMLLFGLLLLAWASRGLVRALRAIHALAWGVPLTKLRSMPRAVGTLNGLALIALAAIVVVNWMRDRWVLGGLALTGGILLVYFVLWLVATWFLPRAAGASPLALLPGAIVAAVGFELTHLVTVLWTSREVSRASSTYGSVGAAVAILFSLYLLARVAVLAAVVSAVVHGRFQRGQGLGRFLRPHHAPEG